ncbi:major capsid protein [Treponema succinifaciens]|uniref:major capsid protein n=1 Tax=Treponema succinifaciens TaxID=167 RepID=UPI0023F0758D|nr:major capsid protein [Treponema succinifaciens]
MSDPFNSIRSLVPKRSRRTLVDERSFDYDIGQAIPVEFRDMVPGDNFKIYFNVINRFKPLVSPVMGKLDFWAFYFFVPYRNLDPNFERGITGGDDEDLDEEGNPVAFDYTFPGIGSNFSDTNVQTVKKYSLMDYAGLPVGLTSNSPIAKMCTDYFIRAYHSIYNEWFRDENLQRKRKLMVTKRDFDDSITPSTTVDQEEYGIFNVAWKKDYFTSALLSQQKGIAPSLPLSGDLPVYFSVGNDIPSVDTDVYATSYYQNGVSLNSPNQAATRSGVSVLAGGTGFKTYVDSRVSVPNSGVKGDPSTSSSVVNGLVRLNDGTTFDVSELRTVIQIQKILERANRTGSRYTEYLRSFFSVSPKDARLQRPEFIGARKVPVVINEVLQTSQTTDTSAQGTQAGHGISVASNYVGKYFAEEYGCLVGIAFCRPTPLYTQGVNRQWLKKSRYDFYLPQLCNLSEQGIYAGELYVDNTDDDTKIWGFQGRWNEMRAGTSLACGAMRDTYAYWNFSRHFDSRPELDADFIECKPSESKKIYAVQSEPGIICHFATILDAVRPITAYPEPGRMDHDM